MSAQIQIQVKSGGMISSSLERRLLSLGIDSKASELLEAVFSRPPRNNYKMRMTIDCASIERVGEWYQQLFRHLFQVEINKKRLIKISKNGVAESIIPHCPQIDQRRKTHSSSATEQAKQ